MTHDDNHLPPVVYLVVAYRLGGTDNVFPIGVFATRADARDAARQHFVKRGGKYEHRISAMILGDWSDRQKSLADAPTVEAEDRAKNKLTLPLNHPGRIS